MSLQKKFISFLKDIEISEGFKHTNITKETYLDVIEMCINSYSTEELLKMSAKDDMHACSRIVSSLAVLLANGRMAEKKALFENMMTDACEAIDIIKPNIFLDFAVKELMIAYRQMKNNVSKELLSSWAECLKRVSPEKYYLLASGKFHNINIYNLSGEWLRHTEGFTDAKPYLESCWALQIEKFDKNGMYLDNFETNLYRNPMLYDLTTRVQVQLITGNGYSDKYHDEIDENLEKGGYMTLFMQSASGEFSYGGRSNQYIFNEGLIASNCEYEAARYAKKGDLKTAGIYKRCAHLAIKSINRWLYAKKHLKNFYNSQSIGTENYGYYNKYMITLGSFLAIGFLFADDTIEEFPCPSEIGGYIFETSKHFNKIFATCCGYSLEFDTHPDSSYDSAGLGRIHKAGVPTELALSMPISAKPNYVLPEHILNQDLSIEAGWDTGDGTVQYLSQLKEVNHTISVLTEQRDKVNFKITYFGDEIKGADSLCETYTIDKDGVRIKAELINPVRDKIFFKIPLLKRNGDNTFSSNTVISSTQNIASVSMGEFKYSIETDGSFSVSPSVFANRNGEYQAADINKPGNKLTVKFKLS